MYVLYGIRTADGEVSALLQHDCCDRRTGKNFGQECASLVIDIE